MTSRIHRMLIGLTMLATLVIAAPVVPTAASASPIGNRSGNSLTVAVFGDVPYGVEQEAAFPKLIDAINRDPKVRVSIHVGDIKSGSVACSDERFAAVAAGFATLKDPLVYTPGDNEWADCHRVNNGSYNPLERLSAVRSLFFPDPGKTLGRHTKQVDYQPEMVENVRWVDSRVAFASLHVIGSNNGLSPWSGIGSATPTPDQVAEVQSRIDAALAWVDSTFDRAEAHNLRGVVLAMQADTWQPGPSSAQQAIVDRIESRTAGYDGEVLLLQGDSHQYLVDNPLGLDNFTRIVVQGETLPFEYLRLTVDPRNPDVFSWVRVPVE